MPEMDSPPRMMPWRLRALLGQAVLVPLRRSDLLIFELKNCEEEIFMKINEFFLIHVQTFVSRSNDDPIKIPRFRGSFKNCIGQSKTIWDFDRYSSG